MAVENKYVDADIVSGKKTSAAFTGAQVIEMVATEEIAAADDDGSVYRFFKGVPANLIPVEITIACDAITGMTDCDLGLYLTNTGAVVDKDVLMDGQTLASALTRASGHQLGLQTVNIADAGKTLAELDAVSTDTPASYDIALTANTVGSAAGTVTIYAKFMSK